MDFLEICDVLPEMDDKDLSDLSFEQPWMTDMFDSIDDKFLKDELLTDIMSRSSCKIESFDPEIFEFVNDIVVGDEVEVNNSPESQNTLSTYQSTPDNHEKEENLTNNRLSDTSSENLRLSPDFGNSSSTSSILSDSGISSIKLSPNKKIKKAYSNDEKETRISECYSSPNKLPSSAINRVRYVVQKGQALVFKPEQIPSNSMHPKSISNGDSESFQTRITDKFGNVRSNITLDKSILSCDSGESCNSKQFSQRNRQLSHQIYLPTPPGSQTSSDTDIGDTPIQLSDSRQYNKGNGRFNMFTRLNNPCIRIHSGMYASRYPNNTYVYNQSDENFDTLSVDGDNSDVLNSNSSRVMNNSDSLSGYSNSYQSNNYRQQNMFQNTQMTQSGVLLLSEEEKRTLIAEGYPVPNRLPLSKQEERNLKKIRRKIKNKISAQESRRKKKEYVETLEKRVEVYTQENMDLKRRLDGIEGTNRSLLSQLRHLEQLVSKSNSNNTISACSSSTPGNKRNSSNVHNNDGYTANSSRNGSASTCLMVFLLCFAALFAGQPTGELNFSSSLILRPSYSLSSSSSSSGDLLGSLSEISSIHQIGYTWSGKRSNSITTNKHGNISSQSGDVSRLSSKYNLVPLQGIHQSEHFHNKPASRSRLLGSSKELEECEPLTWMEYFFGNSFSTIKDENTVLPTNFNNLHSANTNHLHTAPTILSFLPNATHQQARSSKGIASVLTGTAKLTTSIIQTA